MANILDVVSNIKNSILDVEIVFSKDLTKTKPKIKQFFWEVNDYCNSKCKSCDIWKRPANKNYLDIEQVQKLFRSGFFSEVTEVIVSGGEPGLHPNLAECIIEIAQNVDKNCVFSLSTNGLMPNKIIDLCDTLLSHKVNFLVGISLDGIGDKHDEERGVKGNFSKVDRLIDDLNIKRNPNGVLTTPLFRIIVGSTLSASTAESSFEIEKYAKGKCVDYLPQMYEEFSYYGDYEDGGRFGAANNKDALVKDKYSEFEYFDESTPKKIIPILNEKLPSFQYNLMKDAVKDRHLSYKCASMRRFFLLHANGDVSPCLKYAHIRDFNIFENFEKNWYGKPGNIMRSRVDNCVGCSNTWATGWSMKHWIFSFVPFLLRLQLNKFWFKFKKLIF